MNVTYGSDNIFADLGFADPETELARADLASAIADTMRENGLSPTTAAPLLDLDPTTVAALIRGGTEEFTMDRLLHLLNRLGQDVRVSIAPRQGPHSRMSVSLLQTF